VADDYLFKSKLENFLVLAIREVIRGEYLPKNPFPRILRSLYQSLWFNISNADIKKRKNKYIKNFIEKNEYPYKITKVKDKIDVFGYNYIL
jgi:hypothetical protein